MTLAKLLSLSGVLLGLGISLPIAAQSGGVAAMLGGLIKGEWTVRFRDGQPDRKICVRSGEELVQLRHTAKNCRRFVVEDAADAVTIQYTCPSDGYGRTSIRRETSTLVQIESQGIASDVPFQLTAEARRTGSCR